MSALELRPRFKENIDLEPQEIINRINAYRQNPDRQIEAATVDNQAVLSILPHNQHYWSPQLSLEINKEEENTIIRGLYGPNPKVWTMFVFFYSGLSFTGLTGLMYGLVQWSLGMSPQALWIAALALILEIVFFIIARTGKKLASRQMVLLQDELNKILL